MRSYTFQNIFIGQYGSSALKGRVGRLHTTSGYSGNIKLLLFYKTVLSQIMRASLESVKNIVM